LSRRVQSRGTCTYCGQEYSRSGMSRHLASCTERTAAWVEKPDGSDRRLYYLRFHDAWDGAYWLHLEVDGSATLGDLDSYLRAIWLECCGHLSEFSVGRRYGTRVAMSRRIHQVFAPDVEIVHVYDFGTESVTKIKLIASRKGKRASGHPIALMARNLPPLAICEECDGNATHLCHECQIEEDRPGLLCHDHAASHPHEDYGRPIPIVNSPRVGLCGYTGPAEPPY
jgi:hypothetical protein